MHDKIAIILNGHSGATFPLVYHLLHSGGYKVDLYCNTSKHVFADVEGMDIEPITHKSSIQEIASVEAPSIYDYFHSENFKLFFFCFPRPYDHAKILHVVSYPRLFIAYYHFVKFINCRQYKWINIISRYEVSYNPFIIKRLNPCPTVSLHEVCDHYNLHSGKKLKDPKIYKAIRERNCNLVIHSDNALRDLARFNINPNCVYRINFGLFETYRSCVDGKQLQLPPKYILYIGIISNYKGLDLLYEAVNQTAFPEDYKIVIAGKGNVPILDIMRSDGRYLLLNRYLSNTEFAELIRRSAFLVCPYKTMSQSGIPQTAFLFNKPVLASDLDGFREIITNGENGLLFKTGDVSSLSSAIENMLESYKAYDGNIKNFENLHPEYSWDVIVSHYEQTFINRI